MSNAIRHVNKCSNGDSNAHITISNNSGEVGGCITLDIDSLQVSDADALLLQTTPLIIPAGETPSDLSIRQERLIVAYNIVRLYPKEFELVIEQGEGDDEDNQLWLKCKLCIPTRGPTAGQRWKTKVHGTGDLKVNLDAHRKCNMHSEKSIAKNSNLHQFFKAVSFSLFLI